MHHVHGRALGQGLRLSRGFVEGWAHRQRSVHDSSHGAFIMTHPECPRHPVPTLQEGAVVGGTEAEAGTWSPGC